MKWLFAGIWLIAHLFLLDSLTGIHYDEAWAALYAYRIAFEPGFWPLSAMSPYTMPWAHYWAALFFKLFGVNLFVFRLSQLVLAFLGTVFLFLAVRRRSGERAANIFLVLVSTGTFFLLNQRFAIELTGWHVLCLGVGLFSLERRWAITAMIAALMGVTSHILFIGYVMAFLAYLLFQSIPLSAQQRNQIGIGLFLLTMFSVKVMNQVPERGKTTLLATGLILLSIIFIRYYEPTAALVSRNKNTLKALIGLAALPFGMNLLFFLGGEWSQLIVNGLLPQPFWVVPNGLLVIGIIAVSIRDRDTALLGFFFLALIAIGILSLKPAPRYYHLLGIALMALAAMSLAKRKWALWLVAIFALCQGGSFFSNTYIAWRDDLYADRALRWGPWKDWSHEYLHKQKLVKHLALKGCLLSGINGGDIRVLKSLQFLSLGDWHPVGRCPWRSYRVERVGGINWAENLGEDSIAGFEIYREE